MNKNFIYINYYSRLRITDNPELERRTNLGRIVTKRILRDELKYESYVKKPKGLYELVCTVINIDSNRMNYEVFEIPKRRGGTRTIYAPDEYTLYSQHQILEKLNKARVIATNNAHGFVKNRNCKTALEHHKKHHSRWFLKMDIKKFFDNTNCEMVLRALNYNYPLCNLPASTKRKLADIVTYNGYTPQGAATSPAICNIVLTPFDYAFQKYCHNNGLIYTRYADDILVSSEVDFDWHAVQDIVQQYLGMLGYEINTEKTRYGSYAGRNWNLGLMYNSNDDITIGHRNHHILKCRVHNYITASERTAEEYYKLVGLLGYWKYIEENNELPQKLLATVNEYKPTGGTNG